MVFLSPESEESWVSILEKELWSYVDVYLLVLQGDIIGLEILRLSYPGQFDILHHFPGPYIEFYAMCGTLNSESFQDALRKVSLLVRAETLYRVEYIVHVDQKNSMAFDFDPPHTRALEVFDPPNPVLSQVISPDIIGNFNDISFYALMTLNMHIRP